MKTLVQRCPACHTITTSAAPYCDACGRAFSARAVESSRRWKYRALAIALGLAVAIGYQFIRQFRG